MKALTLRPPFGYAFAHLGKPIENRSKPLGRDSIGKIVAIHNGKVPKLGGVPSADWREIYASMSGIEDAGVFVNDNWAADVVYEGSAICCAGVLDRIIEHGDGDPMNRHVFRNDERFGLVFRDVRVFDPIPWKQGQLGCWGLNEMGGLPR